MNRKLRGLYTFDEDTHKYVPVSSVPEIWENCEEDKSGEIMHEHHGWQRKGKNGH